MSDVKKTISINPAFLSTSRIKSTARSTRKNNQTKIKQKAATLVRPNKLRKQLLERMKNRLEDTKENKQEEKDSQEFEDEFNKSLGFLQDLVIKNRTPSVRKNKTLKKPNSVISVDTELPDDFEQSVQNRNHGQPIPQGQHIPPIPHIPQGQHIPHIPQPKTYEPYRLTLPPTPPYSTLKNGSNPTYREWRYKTQKVNNYVNSSRSMLQNTKNPLINIEDKPFVQETSRSTALANLKADYKMNNPSKKNMARFKRTSTTVKYHLGKSNNKVSVLIKNKQTRKKVQHEQALLRQTSIVEIKNYLRNKNLLKTGSNSPNDVLREMYEQSILSGDINNTSNNTLMHNFLTS